MKTFSKLESLNREAMVDEKDVQNLLNDLRIIINLIN